jgi:hypothetical protein
VKADTDFRSGRPEPGEYADYAQADIDMVEGDDAVIDRPRLYVEPTVIEAQKQMRVRHHP